MTLDDLRTLIDTGKFHHATVKVGLGRCWNGLYIYERGEGPGYFRGFRLAGFFPYGWEPQASPEFEAASDMVARFGTSFGSYGQG